ncbi:MAG: hypothetical protein IIZ12_03795 [Eggerthellaceae bacterium]|nr:hypothetical protein [Eggerthellaceae bacterium]
MTDNRTTELREKLRELGIEFATDDFGDLLTTILWVDGIFAKYLDWCEDEDVPTLKIRMKRVTPEQAISATLGNGTLTAEQVRKAIARHGAMLRGCVWQIQDASCDAIADDLNATLGSEVRDD